MKVTYKDKRNRFVVGNTQNIFDISMKMLGVKFINDSKGEGLKPVVEAGLHIPEPYGGEALVKVIYSAICSTDLEILKVLY